MRRVLPLLILSLVACDGRIGDTSRPGTAARLPAPTPEPAECGDMTCDRGETCSSCEADCGACAPGCGDGMCNGDEDCGSCPDDCGTCPAVCGDMTCDLDEDCMSCEADCGVCPAVCGDGMCDAMETCDSCEADCGVCTWPPELTATEDEMLVLVNELRMTGATCGGRQYDPVPPLQMHEALRDAARLHSQDMGEQNYFDHTSLDGRSPWQRISDSGYPGAGSAENIAAGNNSAQATFNQWLNSSGHCRNMMTRNANEIGIGHANVPGSRFRHYWTQKFGRR